MPVMSLSVAKAVKPTKVQLKVQNWCLPSLDWGLPLGLMFEPLGGLPRYITMYQHPLDFIALWMGVDNLYLYNNKNTCYLTSPRSNKIS